MQILINNKEISLELRDKIISLYPPKDLFKKKMWIITTLPFGKGEVIEIVNSYSKAKRRVYTRFKRKRKGYYTRIVVKKTSVKSLISKIINELQP